MYTGIQVSQKNHSIVMYASLDPVRKHFQKRRLFWSGLLALSILMSVYAYWSYRQINWQTTAYFQQIYEKKSLSQLDVFHNGLQTYLESFLDRRLQFIWNFSSDPQLGLILRNENSAVSLQDILERQRRIDNSFESLGVMDKHGTLLAVASDYPDAAVLVGQDLSLRPYAEKTFRTKDASIVPVFQTLTGRKTIFFTAPIFDQSGEIEYVLLAAETFDHFSRYLPIQSRFSFFQSLILDDRGYILLDHGKSVPEKTGTGTSERVPERLLAGEETVEEQEVNYIGEKVFAKGSSLHFGSTNHFFLITYYPLAQFATETWQLEQTMNQLSVSLLWQFLLAFGVFLLVLVGLIRHQ